MPCLPILKYYSARFIHGNISMGLSICVANFLLKAKKFLEPSERELKMASWCCFSDLCRAAFLFAVCVYKATIYQKDKQPMYTQRGLRERKRFLVVCKMNPLSSKHFHEYVVNFKHFKVVSNKRHFNFLNSTMLTATLHLPIQ
jgi:hypothetical protein